MKQTLLIITALMLVFGCGSSEKEPEKELINYETTLIERDGVFYTKDTNKPYSGLVLALYNNGEKKSEGTLKDGEPDGVWTYWHENGQKESEGTYKNGKEDGKWTRWYENGQKRVEKNYKDGEEIGSTDWEYYSNGQKRVERNYKDGKEDGKWTYWNEDGREIFPIIPEFVAVKGGTFQMGSNSGRIDEKPVHSVTVSDFNISKTEVTFEQYDAFCDAIGRDKPDDEGWGRGNRPVIYVDWQDAFDYCEWMSKTTGKTYRLPTEAEWEYAARGGSKSKGYTYSGGNNLYAVAWYDNNSRDKTHPVAQKQPNELGLYDMSGNVYEWCSDWYGDYSSSPQTDPQGSNSEEYRVLRGGGWLHHDSGCRVAFRLGYSPDGRYNFYGFRLVLSPDLSA
ncbi:MAG: SUMF1/EgtB/PvdO family nonheme iron enzyme [Candidatus Marinimicrobia bacterium]|jgi:formylglycine-generating enzyme required for sulfatase activity|nr:SUMF1/EgtB/PvdO family nonheme iron enzyme [Candidatus Neomarinimicrobiota bacterium]MDP7527218.1 SUMF1/EgtB/PvdO family nonheme iron enzyme [Candidatus Neomarinimicrobiota bacterium]